MGNKRHLLIIDDEAPICDMLVEYFEKHGFHVTTSLHGHGGMRLIEENPYDLIILDIALPDSDGLELLEIIKRRHPSLPVIMLTGLGYDDELVNEAQRKKASGYVSKRLPLEQLLMEVHRVLKGPSQNPVFVPMA